MNQEQALQQNAAQLETLQTTRSELEAQLADEHRLASDLRAELDQAKLRAATSEGALSDALAELSASRDRLARGEGELASERCTAGDDQRQVSNMTSAARLQDNARPTPQLLEAQRTNQSSRWIAFTISEIFRRDPGERVGPGDRGGTGACFEQTARYPE